MSPEEFRKEVASVIEREKEYMTARFLADNPSLKIGDIALRQRRTTAGIVVTVGRGTVSEENQALKEENKRLREALEEMVQRYDAAEESSEIWDGPDYLGSYNMFQAECSEIIGIARSALKEE